MATLDRPALRPLRLPGAVSSGRRPRALPPVPQLAPEHELAPDWRGETEDNGVLAPRADLHIALVAPDLATAREWKKNAFLVTPPLWKDGRVHIHVILDNRKTKYGELPMKLLQAMADLGLMDAKDLEISKADMLFDLGYPSVHEQPKNPDLDL